MCNKSRHPYCKRLGLILVLLLAAASYSYGQLQGIPYLGYLQQIKKVTNYPVLTYSYKVLLQENKTGKTVDNVAGKIYRHNDAYLDSNGFAISMVSEGYYFKGDYRKKAAYVYDLAEVEKKMGLKREDMVTSVLDIPDSMINKMGYLSADDRPDVLLLKYVLKEKAGSLQELQFRIRKKDMILEEINIRVLSGDATGNTTTYTMYGFSNEFNLQKLSTANYFKVSGKKARLLGRYQTYKLNAFL